MIRIACALAILALVALLAMVLRTSGGTATLYAFIGIPSLAVAVVLYLAAEGTHIKRLFVRWLGGTSTILALTVGVGAGVPGATARAGADENSTDPAAAAYVRACASCHGTAGLADTPAGRAMKVPAFAGRALSVDQIIEAVRSHPKHKAASSKTDDETLSEMARYLEAKFSREGGA